MQFNFLEAFVLTLLIETPIYIWFYKKRGQQMMAIVSILMNAITLPFVWFIFYPALADYATFFVSSELYVLGAEAVLLGELFKKEGWKRAIAASMFANAMSAGAGLLLTFAL